MTLGEIALCIYWREGEAGMTCAASCKSHDRGKRGREGSEMLEKFFDGQTDILVLIPRHSATKIYAGRRHTPIVSVPIMLADTQGTPMQRAQRRWRDNGLGVSASRSKLT